MKARTIHALADTQTISWTPWSIPAAFQFLQWPTVEDFQKRYDLWLLECSASRTSGTATPTRASLKLNVGDVPGIAVATGSTTFTGGTHTLARWAGLQGASADMALTWGGDNQKILMRMPWDKNVPPQTSLSWAVVSDGASEYTVTILCAIVPHGLGQDGAL